ncbi:MAG: hydroxymethylglutaryl-CoA lyase [Planctomycetota bacterium]
MTNNPELPKLVNVVEVGPRDGLQNDPRSIPTETKVAFINALADAGLSQIEATSFVNPKAIPQLADAMDVVAQLPDRPEIMFSALVPNEKGLDRAIEAGVKRIAVFTAASETFTKKNINMSVAKSLGVFEKLVPRATKAGMSVRGYVSTCFVCPYEGDVDPDRVVDVSRTLFDIGVDEVAISDTIGKAAPSNVTDLLSRVLEHISRDHIALHMHDTYGMALANVYAGLTLGIATFDSAAGGLGGCPYAPGASGNLATEDLVFMLDRMGIRTSVSLDGIVAASRILAAMP